MVKEEKKEENLWEYQNNPVTSLQDLPNDIFGFVYEIFNITSKKSYIGRKQINSYRKKRLTKKELLLLTDGRASKFKKEVKESNWLTYNGSCKDLLTDIAKGDTIYKKIIEICYTKAELTYFETKHQFKNSVIEGKDYYNDNILGKFYKNIFE